MKIQYKNATWSYNNKNATDLCLDIDDLSHLQKVYHKYNITPETLEKVSVEFILQREALSRFVIKELDILLMVGGVFEISILNSKSHSSYIRSCDQVKYEFSIATNGRYKLINAIELDNSRVLKLFYKKCVETLAIGDSISKWSFGIISDGRKNDKVTALISSIINQKIPNFEVIICGLYSIPNEFLDTDIVVLDDIILEEDLRAPTPAKKNKIVKKAKYNNLCILHDRFILPNNWYSNFESHGNYFDALCMPTIDLHGNRFRVDWMSFNYPITQLKKQNRSLKYSEWTPEVIIQGGILVAKRDLILKFMFDERLHWEELEDMQLSKQAYLAGAFINVDINNFVYSESVNHKAETRPDLNIRLFEMYSWFRGYVSNYIKFRLTQKKYYAEKNSKKPQ
ncbi:hypothetical protein N9P72_00060 [Amylibacter sp.]|nr:hypothetical protein [Amylibacter sp.]